MRETIAYDHTHIPLAAVAAFCSLSVSLALAADRPKSSDARTSVERRVTIRQSAERSNNIRVDSNLVLIPVTVTDRQNRLVTGLDREYFKLFEEGIEQSITHFGTEDAPISVGIVLDCSGSMKEKLAKSRIAITQFLKTANSGDEFSLVTFSDRPELMIEFSGQIEEIQNRLPFINSGGRTALLDALLFTVHQMRRAHNSRKAILVVSDGGDNVSRYSLKEVKNVIREADVQIFSISIVEPLLDRRWISDEMLGPALLHEISVQTGGRLFEVDNLNKLPQIASKIGLALRLQYTLGYTPLNVAKDGKYHKVKVEITRPVDKQKLQLSWRLGYYAPSE